MRTVFDELLSGVQSFLAGFDEQAARSFVAGVDWSMPARELVPHALPCLVHLDRAAVIAGEEGRALAAQLRDHALGLALSGKRHDERALRYPLCAAAQKALARDVRRRLGDVAVVHRA